MSTKPEAAPREGGDRAEQVRSIFSDIAPRYDLLNHVLSMNIDRRWRRKAVDALGLERRPEGVYLDACCGTFDLSVEIADRPEFDGSVVASDFARPMLVAGQQKLGGRAIGSVCADTLELPFPDGSFDGLTVGFGVRNLADLPKGFAEFRRVLRPGGRAVILEFTVPPNALVRSGYLMYFNHILPVVGRIISGHPWAYTYLPESVREFPTPAELGTLLSDAGFGSVEWSLLSFGIAALHVAEVT
jgi:demethylmenaquinone methyltransferase/2-methoxy-6-polyprenyl-1,4-benzoquinol methylase